MTYPMTVIDTIFKALAPALPEQVIAGHHADLVVGRINGRRPKDDSFYIYLGGLIGGGWGAKYNSDGRNVDHRDERRRHPQRPVRAGRGEVSAAGRALCAAAGLRRRRPLPRRPRLRAGGAGAPPDPLQLADGSREVQAVGPGRRPVGPRQRRRDASRFGKTEETALPERQGAQPGAAARRRLHDALRRRRRLRLAARARPRRRWSATCAAATSAGTRRRKTTARCSTPDRHARHRGDRDAPRRDARSRACRTTSRSPTPACRRPPHPQHHQSTTTRTRSSPRKSASRSR